jgi:MFS family permease
VHRSDRTGAIGVYGDHAASAIVRHKPFALFWTARMSSIIAFQVQAVAVGWQIYNLTGSAFYLGLVGLAQFLPMFFLTLVVGYVSDHFDRRSVVWFCQLTEGLAALTLAAGSFGGWLNEQVILVVTFVLGSARAFEGPSMQALMPGLVPREFFPPAAAWTASATQMAAICGPALGGLLYAANAPISYAAAGGHLSVGWLTRFPDSSSKRSWRTRADHDAVGVCRNRVHPQSSGDLGRHITRSLRGPSGGSNGAPANLCP